MTSKTDKPNPGRAAAPGQSPGTKGSGVGKAMEAVTKKDGKKSVMFVKTNKNRKSTCKRCLFMLTYLCC